MLRSGGVVPGVVGWLRKGVGAPRTLDRAVRVTFSTSAATTRSRGEDEAPWLQRLASTLPATRPLLAAASVPPSPLLPLHVVVSEQRN
jgi:hypothetical protein